VGGIVLRPLARADLVDAWDYIAGESGPDRADDYLDRLAQRLQRLAEQPYMGRARPELAPGLRSFPAASHVVFYRPDAGGIIVVRVLHGRRDVERLSF
jgi:toxin ParE1/3/4